MKTDAVYNNREAAEQMESLTFNCINMTQRDEPFVPIRVGRFWNCKKNNAVKVAK